MYRTGVPKSCMTYLLFDIMYNRLFQSFRFLCNDDDDFSLTNLHLRILNIQLCYTVYQHCFASKLLFAAHV